MVAYIVDIIGRRHVRAVFRGVEGDAAMKLALLHFLRDATMAAAVPKAVATIDIGLAKQRTQHGDSIGPVVVIADRVRRRTAKRSEPALSRGLSLNRILLRGGPASRGHRCVVRTT